MQYNYVVTAHKPSNVNLSVTGEIPLQTTMEPSLALTFILGGVLDEVNEVQALAALPAAGILRRAMPQSVGRWTPPHACG